MATYLTDERFRNQDFTPTATEYDGCSFVTCRLAGADLTGIRFLDCTFQDCDLSNATLTGASFQNVHFASCKLLGLSFDAGDPLAFAVTFADCRLQHASFHKMKLTRCAFTGCDLTEADFTAADLTGSTLVDCDLARATFENTDLRKADLREARHYRIDPTRNRVRGTRFSLPAAVGLLETFGVRID
ncbi:pentapeptide repeat-containing protein [Lewinella sp. IMCC34191]|uniref:pentapeptide repeat-containing protein n=1 Tax=Lewinella sp. IMCC34191 TaxID=2259172 RepID=UPI000E286530|nr:pentapeptide repeat-containing protein [Lewinella sp. IMCC34191]